MGATSSTSNNHNLLSNITTITTTPETSVSYVPPYGPAETAVIAVIAAILAVLTAGGNILVMLSLRVDKQLRTITNYFLLSLAFADLMIGLISMPLFTMYILYGYWPLGALVCDTWLATDYLMSNASVLNLLIISFDRYLSITRPLTYRARRTTRRAVWMIAAAWLISLVLWPPWIYAWPYIEGKRSVKKDHCYIQFLDTNIYLTIGTACIAFYLPVTVMTVLYVKIWLETQRRQRDLQHLTADPGKRPIGQISQKSTSSSDDPPIAIHPPPAYSTAAIPHSSSSATLRPKRPSHIPSNHLPPPPPQPLWRRISSCCNCKIDRETTDYVDDDSSDDAAENTPGTSDTNNRTLPTNRITSSDREKNGRISIPLLPKEPQTQQQMLADPTVDSETYTILITFPEAAGHLSRNRPRIEQMSFDTDSDIGVPEEPARTRMSSLDAPGVNSPGRSPKSLSRQSVSHANTVVQTTKTASRTRVHAPGHQRRKVEKKQDKKAAKTLSAILFAFIITWTPYNVFVLINSMFPNTVPSEVFNISYYLCYINSTINPICYALCNANFRKTYIRILSCRKSQKSNAPYGRNN